MIRRSFLRNLIGVIGINFFPKRAFSASPFMKITLLRHATLLIDIDGRRILVDPMLNKKEAMDTVANAANSLRNPLVDLPMDDSAVLEMLTSIDLVLITHTHRDHWDTKAIELINKSTPIICQTVDEEKIRSQGFTDVRSVKDKIEFSQLTIHKTSGQHGKGEIGKKMGEVSGFVIESSKTKVYIAGDTVFCKEVEDALSLFKPNVVVLNAGAAQFTQGGPITMTGEDVMSVAKKLPKARVIAVHMDAINHCLLKRSDLKNALLEHNLFDKVSVPEDGTSILFQ